MFLVGRFQALLFSAILCYSVAWLRKSVLILRLHCNSIPLLCLADPNLAIPFLCNQCQATPFRCIPCYSLAQRPLAFPKQGYSSQDHAFPPRCTPKHLFSIAWPILAIQFRCCSEPYQALLFLSCSADFLSSSTLGQTPPGSSKAFRCVAVPSPY